MPIVHAAGQTLVDAQGFRGTCRYLTTADTIAHAQANALSINNLIAALSNAAALNGIGITDNLTQAPQTRGTAASYLSKSFRAELTFVTGQGTLVKIGVPAPKTGIFLADLETVNKAQADVAAFLAAILAVVSTAVVCDKDGNAVTAYVNGFLRKSRVPRKETLWSLSPGLDEPGE